MSLEKSVSVIVPAYNAAGHLHACLDALLERQGIRVDVIVVDDGSTDATPRLLGEYQRRYRNLKVLRHERNLGVSAARNTGLEAASGDYILFVDADDRLHDGAVPVLLDACSACGADILMFQFEVVKGDARCIRRTCTTPERYDLTDGSQCRKAFYHVGAFLPWNGFFARESIQRLRFKAFTHGEDTLFVFEAFLAAAVFGVIPEVLYEYHQRPGSASQTVTLQHLRSQMGVAREMARVTKESARYACIREPFCRKLWNHMTGYLLERLPSLSPRERGLFWEEWFDHLEALFLGGNNHSAVRYKIVCHFLCHARSPALVSCLVSPVLMGKRVFMRIPIMADLWRRYRKSATGA